MIDPGKKDEYGNDLIEWVYSNTGKLGLSNGFGKKIAATPGVAVGCPYFN